MTPVITLRSVRARRELAGTTLAPSFVDTLINALEHAPTNFAKVVIVTRSLHGNPADARAWLVRTGYWDGDYCAACHQLVDRSKREPAAFDRETKVVYHRRCVK